MKFSMDFGRSANAKVALAVAGLLAIGGAVGSAIAMSPVVQPPIKWAGGAEFDLAHPGGGFLVAYVVPAGRNLILTDLILGNSTTAPQAINVYSAAPGTCADRSRRLHNIVVPGQSTVSVSLQTGIGFTSGQAVCVEAGGQLGLNGRGFLFTPAPAI